MDGSFFRVSGGKNGCYAPTFYVSTVYKLAFCAILNLHVWITEAFRAAATRGFFGKTMPLGFGSGGKVKEYG